MIETILPVVQLAVLCANLMTMLYALSKVARRPHNELEQRIIALEAKTNQIEEALHKGNDKFRELKNASTLIVTSVVALIEFEIDYCMHHGDEKISESLNEAKRNLYQYLAEK